MDTSSFISVLGKNLLPILEDPKQDPDEVVLTERGKDYTAAQLARVVREHPDTMFHIPRPR